MNLLLDYSFFEKAEATLLNSQWSSTSDLNVFQLYSDLYSRTGDLEKLEKLLSNSGRGKRSHARPDPQNLAFHAIAYDAEYFSSQVFDFVSDLLKIYSKQHKDLRRAYLQAKAGMISEAKYFLRKFSDQLEEDAGKYLIRAELALIEGRYEKAKGMFDRLSHMPKFSLLANNRLGDISNAMGDSIAASNYYKTAIELNPNHFDTLLDLIKTSILGNDIQAAKRYYNQTKAEFGEDRILSLKPLLTDNKRTLKAGSVNGLVWSEITGNVLPIEILSKPSQKFELTCSGNIGYAMRDSIETVMDALKVSEIEMKVLSSSFKINVPYASTFKDGRSAGLALLIGCWSQFQGCPDLSNYAFTGELSLSGKVLPVGGIPEKLFGAYMNGVSEVFLPAANYYDLRTVSSKIKEDLLFPFFTDYKEAIEVLWNQ